MPGLRRHPESAIPVQVSVKIIRPICSTLASFIVFWISLCIVALYIVPL